MARRIAHLTPGETVTVKFHKGYGSAESRELNRFLGMFDDTTGIARINARFETVDGAHSYTWEAYRYDDRWCYGDNAQRVSVL